MVVVLECVHPSKLSKEVIGVVQIKSILKPNEKT